MRLELSLSNPRERKKKVVFTVHCEVVWRKLVSKNDDILVLME